MLERTCLWVSVSPGFPHRRNERKIEQNPRCSLLTKRPQARAFRKIPLGFTCVEHVYGENVSFTNGRHCERNYFARLSSFPQNNNKRTINSGSRGANLKKNPQQNSPKKPLVVFFFYFSYFQIYVNVFEFERHV